MKIKIKKTHPDAQLPHFASAGAACFDLYADSSEGLSEDGNWIHTEIGRDSTCVFGTGLAFEIPPGFALMVYSRSGHGFKSDVSLSNAVGVIDSDYRGEVKVKLRNDGTRPFVVCRGDRIAQAMMVMLPSVSGFEVVEDLSRTERGAGGLGSTGK